LLEPIGQGCSRTVGVELLAVGFLRAARNWRHQPEIDVHRLEGLSVRAAGDVTKQGPHRCLSRRRCEPFATQLGGGKARGDQADSRAFDIAFAAGDLTGEADVGLGLEPQLAVEQPRRVDEAVAVNPTMFHKVPSALSWRSCTTA
jgi:hypothetical protein